MKKTITVQKDIWKKLTKLKLSWGCETLGEVVERLFIILTKVKSGGKLK